jgi:hypothetical protein
MHPNHSAVIFNRKMDCRDIVAADGKVGPIASSEEHALPFRKILAQRAVSLVVVKKRDLHKRSLSPAVFTPLGRPCLAALSPELFLYLAHGVFVAISP